MTDERSKVLLRSAVLILITFVAHIPALRGGFIWDDDDYVTNNPNPGFDDWNLSWTQWLAGSAAGVQGR